MDIESMHARELDRNLSRTAEKYDLLPYESKPVSRSHPARIAAVAHLFGLDAPPVPTARVLELGCAAGGNIIPMATFYPDARFLGVDLGGKQIEQGQARAAQAGLANIELRHQSITDLGEEIGEFDYIICHGVYSWVPAPVQEKILEICGRNLSSAGIAYVSYNVLPGWRMFQPLRDAFRMMVPKTLDEMNRVSLARQLLKYMSALTPHEGAYAELLKKAPEELLKHDDSYLYHEYMEEVNEPCTFVDFINAASQYRLGYLGECEIFPMYAESYGSDFAEKFHQSVGGDIVANEQMLDILTGIAFRATLLVSQERLPQINRNEASRRLSALHFMVSKFITVEIDGRKAKVTVPNGKSNTYVEPKAVALIERLHASSPASLSFAECTEGFSEDDLPAVKDLLLAMTVGGLVNVSLEPMPAAKGSLKPCANRLARVDAAAGRRLTATRQHYSVEIDAMAAFLLPHLDGTADHAFLERLLLDAVGAGEVKVEAADGSCPPKEELGEVVSSLVSKGLIEIAALGMLEA